MRKDINLEAIELLANNNDSAFLFWLLIAYNKLRYYPILSKLYGV